MLSSLAFYEVPNLGLTFLYFKPNLILEKFTYSFTLLSFVNYHKPFIQLIFCEILKNFLNLVYHRIHSITTVTNRYLIIYNLIRNAYIVIKFDEVNVNLF